MIYNITKYNAHWETQKLRRLGDFSRGKSKHRPRNDSILYDGGGYPFIQTGQIKATELYIDNHVQEYNEVGLLQSKLWKEGTLAITIAANIAETGIISYPMCFPDSVVGFVANPIKTSELYMHYIFAFIRTSIQKSVGGSIQDNINIDYLENLNFKIPDKRIQDNIVAVLSSLDRKIALNNAINAELESTARLLYDYWFTQFDFPDANGKPYKSSGGAMVWNEQLKREIPEGWIVKRLGSLGNFQNGVNYSKDEDGCTRAKIVNVRDISSSSTFIDIEKCDSLSLYSRVVDRFTLSPDDLLIARSGIPGSVRLIFDTPNKVIYCGFSIRFNLVNKKLRNYIFFALKNIETSTTKRSTGSILKNVSQDTLRDYAVSLPQDEIIEKFNIALEPLFHGMIGRVKENKELTTLRDFLLPLLMNGQVTIAEADVAAPEAEAEAPVISVKQAKNKFKPKPQQTKPSGFDDARYEEWKLEIGVAARGDMDEQTLKNIYEAMDEDDR